MSIKNSNNNNSNNSNNSYSNNDHNNSLYSKIFNNKLLKKDIDRYVKLNCDWRIKKISNEQFWKSNYNQYILNDSTFKYILLEDFYSIEEFNKFIKSLESRITSNINDRKIESGSNNMVGLSVYKSNIKVKLSKFKIPSTIIILELDGVSIELEEGAPLFKKLFGRDKPSSSSSSSSSIFNNLTVLDLGKFNEHVLQNGYLYNSKNLKKLTLSHQFTASITQQMLPDQIEQLIFKSGYGYNEIYFPSSLKELSFIGKPNYVVGFNFKILDYIPQSLTSIVMEYCDTMDILSTRKLVNQLKRLSITHNKIYLSTFNILLNSLYQNNNHYFQDQNIPGYTNTSLNTSYQIKTPNHITLDQRKKIPQPILESLTMNLYGGPLTMTEPDLLPSSLKELSLPLNLSVSVTGVKRGYPGSITSFEGTLSHLSTKFESPQNITSLGTIITTEYTAQNINTPLVDSFNIRGLLKNNIDYSSINIDNNNQLINQFINLKSLKLYFIESSNLISSLPTSIDNLEISTYNSVQNYDQFQFSFNLSDLINLKSLRLDDVFTYLLIQKLNSKSKSTLITESPFPSTLLLLDLSFTSKFNTANLKLNQSFFSPIKFLIIRGDHNPDISSLPPFLELIFIQDSNPILNDNTFISHYSSIIRTFNTFDENIIYNNLKNKINNIYIFI